MYEILVVLELSVGTVGADYIVSLSIVCTYRKIINSMLFSLHMVGTIPYGVKRVLLCTYPYFCVVFSIRQFPG